jgi:hypothetical protein
MSNQAIKEIFLNKKNDIEKCNILCIGVTNKDKGHIYKINDFEWIDGAKEPIKYLND